MKNYNKGNTMLKSNTTLYIHTISKKFHHSFFYLFLDNISFHHFPVHYCPLLSTTFHYKSYQYNTLLRNLSYETSIPVLSILNEVVELEPVGEEVSEEVSEEEVGVVRAE